MIQLNFSTRISKCKLLVLFLLCFIIIGNNLFAALKLPAIFKDGMVLQRDEKITVWGWADKGASVSISFNSLKQVVIASFDGKWTAELGPFPAGGPHELTISADISITVKNIFIGEVWLCSGQSNMQYTMDMLGAKTLKSDFNTDYPIHFYNVQIETDLIPSADIAGGNWQLLNENSAGNLSGTAFYFAKQLQAKLKVPIGIIVSCLGATTIETWMSAQALLPFEAFKPIVQQTMAPNKTKKDLLDDLTRFRVQWDKDYYLNTRGMKEKWFEYDNMPGDWKEVQVPLLWEDLGYDHDGEVWFRKKFDWPGAIKGDQQSVSLNQIDDYDRVWLNGSFIGETFGSRNFRGYFFPSSLVKEKDNLLVVRVFDIGGKGGIYTNAFWGNPILTGKWEMKMGDKMNANDFPKPVVPNMSVFSHPSALFNANIAPLTSYKIKGVIWYQGESNADRAVEYASLFPAMITDWRKWFSEPNLPFHFVQLANYGPEDSLGNPSNWAELRSAQAAALTLPFTSLATAIDVGDALDIHPKDKETVGKRLADNALSQDYGFNIDVKSPQLMKTSFTSDGALMVQFSIPFKKIPKGEKLHAFLIAGADGKFVKADAYLSKNKIKLSSPQVSKPKYIRFAWANNPGKWQLYGVNGNPLLPFRTDQFSLSTAKNFFQFDPFSF